MNAPPVLRPLRAILQRRLQLVPSRPIRTPYYIRASQILPQARFNSSTPPEQPPKPEQTTEDPTKEQASEAQTAESPSPAEESQDINAETHLEPPERRDVAEGEIKLHQAKSDPDEVDIPGEVITKFEMPETAVPRLDDALIRSAFQRLSAVSAEVQAGIEEVVARQIEDNEGSDASEIAEAVEALADAKNVTEFAAGFAAGSAEAAVAEEQEAAAPEVDQLSEAREAADSQVTEETTPSHSEGTVSSESEAVKAAEEVRETEESDVGEVDGPQTEPFTATEAQDIVNENAAKTELDGTPTQEVESNLASLAAIWGEELENSKQETLSAIVETELDDLTEKGIIKLVETKEEQDVVQDVVPGEPSRMPRTVQALYLQPLRRHAKYGVPSCDLQMRSYSVRPLESYCDFALRAAYYLGLPAYGPTPLPKIIERWTVPKASFIFKKSQENFERITRRRLIQIRDGNPATVQIWLAFLQKHQQAGVGMKANVWEFSSLDVAKEMDEAYEVAKPMIDKKLRLLGQDKEFATVEKVDEILTTERYKLAGGR